MAQIPYLGLRVSRVVSMLAHASEESLTAYYKQQLA